MRSIENLNDFDCKNGIMMNIDSIERKIKSITLNDCDTNMVSPNENGSKKKTINKFAI